MYFVIFLIFPSFVKLGVHDGLDNETSLLILHLFVFHVLLDAVKFLHSNSVDIVIFISFVFEYFQKLVGFGIEITGCGIADIYFLDAIGVGFTIDYFYLSIKAATVFVSCLLEEMGEVYLLGLGGEGT
jgi:hypothetical protein